MKRFPTKFFIAALSLAAALQHSHAQTTYYWDSNGPTAGAGATPTGTWGTDAYLSTGAGSSLGTSSTFATTMTEADTLIFSAGTDAINPYTVTVNGTQTSGSLTLNSGTPTLTGGTIALGAGKTITAGTTLAGTATIESAMTVNTNAGGTTLLTLTANDGAAATDLLIKGGISATTPSNVYQIRLAGAGNGRIEGAISNHGGSLSGSWSGTWTIAGNQNLGSTIVSLTAANNKLVLGDSTSDVQGWGTTNVTTSSSVLTVYSTATAGSVVLRGSGGTLDVAGVLNASAFTFGNVSNEFGVLKLSGGNATFTGAGSGMVISGTGNRIIGGAAVNGTLTLAPTSGVALGSGVTLGGAGTHENNLNLVINSTGAQNQPVTLSGVNTFSGTTTISAGVLSLTNSLALQNSALDTAASVAGTAASGLRTDQAALTLGGLTGNKDFASVFTTTTGGYSGVTALTLNPGTGESHTYSGGIANGAAGMSLTKTGGGTQILSGANTYTGGTLVSAGTLVLNGSTSATGNFAVSSGAVLGGDGTIGGTASITGSLRPGNSIGTINTGTTTWLGASTVGTDTNWVFELESGNVSDLLNITGDFTKDTSLGSIFHFDFANSTALGTFTLVNWSGTTSFAVTDFSYANLGGGNTGSFAFNGSQLELTVIPEPSTWALLSLALITLIIYRRRQQSC